MVQTIAIEDVFNIAFDNTVAAFVVFQAVGIGVPTHLSLCSCPCGLRTPVANSAAHRPGVTNFTHTGAPTLTVPPVGVSAPVFWSMRKTTRLSEP